MKITVFSICSLQFIRDELLFDRFLERCWELKSSMSSKYIIELELESFGLEDHDDCAYDYVDIYCDEPGK